MNIKIVVPLSLSGNHLAIRAWLKELEESGLMLTYLEAMFQLNAIGYYESRISDAMDSGNVIEQKRLELLMELARPHC